MYSNRNRGTVGKYLLLVLFVSLLVGFFVWKNSHGLTGAVPVLKGDTANKIVFVRQNGGQTDIFTINADGSDQQQMTSDKGAKRSPSWSPDGRQICYAAEPQTGDADGRSFQIYLIGAGDPRQITYGSQSKDKPQWTGDGRHIAYLAGGAIKIVEPNGTNVLQVYPPPHAGRGSNEEEHPESQPDAEGSGQLPPVDSFLLAPNGVPLIARIVVEGDFLKTNGKADWWKPGQNASDPAASPEEISEPEAAILLPHLESDKPVFLPGANATHIGLAWFPDSIRFAVSVSSSKGLHGIALYRTDDPRGVPQGVFASGGYTVAPENPEVSPDGTKVAFEVWKMEGPENRELMGIAVISTDVSEMVQIRSAADIPKLPIPIAGDAKDPHWSPDGTRILYTKSSPAGRDLWVASADGKNPINLTRGQGDNYSASWSPARR